MFQTSSFSAHLLSRCFESAPSSSFFFLTQPTLIGFCECGEEQEKKEKKKKISSVTLFLLLCACSTTTTTPHRLRHHHQSVLYYVRIWTPVGLSKRSSNPMASGRKVVNCSTTRPPLAPSAHEPFTVFMWTSQEELITFLSCAMFLLGTRV